jgi:hypothetical protein
MSEKKDYLPKAIKYLTGALSLFFIGPSFIYNAFSNKDNNWHYLVLAIGIIGCGYGVYLMFKGLKEIMKAIFDN